MLTRKLMSGILISVFLFAATCAFAADTTPPTGTVKINNNAIYTNSTTVALSLSAADTGSGISKMKFSNNNTTYSGAQPYATAKSWVLTSNNGVKTVYVKYEDAAGNWSEAYSDTIILDTIAPAKPVINTVTSPTNSASQTITGTKTSDTTSIVVTCPTANISTVRYSTSTTWSCVLTNLKSGSNNILVKARDAAGNESVPATAIIVANITAPTGTITINNGNQYTKTTAVTLALSATAPGSNISQMRFSVDNISWSAAEAYTTMKYWTLTAGDGTKTVYVQYKDTTGNWSGLYSDTITLDTVAPAKPVINTVTSPTTILKQTISGTKAKDAASIIVTCPTATMSAVRYPTSAKWSCALSNLKLGINTISVKARDAAGNESAAVILTIIVDLIPPTGTVTINSGNQYTNSTTVTLALSAADTESSVSQMRFSNDNVTWSVAEAYTTTKSWTLATGDGTKTVYVKYKDAAGNWSGAYSDAIILDTTPPPAILTVSLPDGISGDNYRENLNAIDGTPPYVWSIAAQSLPDGLSLDNATGEISGIPTIANTFNFIAGVMDAKLRTATKALSINILPAFPPITDEELLDQTEAKAAMYFYNEILSNGFVKDADYKNFSSVSATGFGLAALCVMAERYQTTPNWTVTPAQARARVNQILDNCIIYQNRQITTGNNYGVAGFLYHFITQDGARQGTCEVSTVDMTLFLAGAITAGEYFGGEVKTKVAQVYNKMNWAYFLNTAKEQFSHGWFPESGVIPATWDRPSDETILVSLLAIGANPNNLDMLKTMYSWPRTAGQYGGYSVVNSHFGSLFTYLFAHCFFDFEKLGIDRPGLTGSTVAPVNWWLNSVNAAAANRQFCIDNSANFASYGENSWGITICEYPNGQYSDCLGAAPCERDYGAPYHDGTIAPYGAISSMPLMRVSLSETLDSNLAFKALRNYYEKYYRYLWGKYGPKDSFNHNKEFSNAYLGIDVGLEVLMIENYRSGLLWNNFMKNTNIARAVKKVFRSADPHDPSFIFVDIANSDDPDEDGSYDHPFNMIQEGIDAAMSGNTIMVSEGIYKESLVINKSGIVLRGDNRGSQIEWFDSSVPVITFSNIDGAETRITGFRIWNPNGGYIKINCDSTVKTLKIDDNVICNASIWLQQDASVVILNNDMPSCAISGQGNNSVHIEGNSIASFSYGDGHNGIDLNGGTALIKNNAVCNSWSLYGAISISNNTFANIIGNVIRDDGSWRGTAGIRVDDSTVNIYNNIFSNNQAFNGGCGGALSAYNSSVTIINNTFNFTKASRGSAAYIVDSNLVAKNNIFYYNDAPEAVYFSGTGAQDFSYNDLCPIYGTSDTTGIIMGAGNIDTDPLFVNVNWDLRLQPSSSCINAGDPDPQYNDKDGTRNDMGAYGGPNSL